MINVKVNRHVAEEIWALLANSKKDHKPGCGFNARQDESLCECGVNLWNRQVVRLRTQLGTIIRAPEVK